MMVWLAIGGMPLRGAFKETKQETTTQTDTTSSTASGWVKQDGSWYYFDGNGNQ